MAAIADFFDSIDNPWLRWPLVFVFGVAMILLALALAQIAWGIVQWMNCLGKETLLCGRLYPLPPQPVL